MVIAVMRHHIVDEVGTDEARSTGNKDIFQILLLAECAPARWPPRLPAGNCQIICRLENPFLTIPGAAAVIILTG